MSILTVTERTHARISPSGFERAEACTMSVRLSAHAPTTAPGPDALTGTAAHAVLEHCLKEDLDTFELGDLERIQIDGQQIEIDDKLLDGVQLCLDVVRRSGLFAGKTLAIERMIHLPFAEQYLGVPMYGYADVLGGPMPVTVLDYKNGFNQVAPDSAQLGLYVLGAVLEVDPTLAGSSIAPNEHAGTSIIVQPNVHDGKVKVHDWTYAALRALRDRVIATLQRIKQSDFTYRYGEHCHFCRAASVCPYLAATASDFALTKVAPTPEMIASGEVTSRMLDDWYQTLKVLDKWSRSFMQTFHDYLVHGGHSEVAKLVRKRTQRRWIDEASAPRELSALGINPYDKVLISPAEAERALPRDKKPIVNKELATKPDGELTVADRDDPREEIVPHEALKAALAASVAAGYLEQAKTRTGREQERGREHGEQSDDCR